MQYAFTHLRGLALSQILLHIWDNGEIGLEDIPALIQLLAAAVGDPDQVATVEWKIQEIKQRNCKFSQYYPKFQLIASDLQLNNYPLKNALRIGLYAEIMDSCT